MTVPIDLHFFTADDSLVRIRLTNSALYPPPPTGYTRRVLHSFEEGGEFWVLTVDKAIEWNPGPPLADAEHS